MIPRPFLSALAVTTSLTLLAGPPCAAQQGDDVSVQCVMLPISVTPRPLEFLPADGEEPVTIDLRSGQFSREVMLPRQEEWRFGVWETRKTADDEIVKVFRERARVNPPAGSEIWLIFHEPAKPDDGEGEAEDSLNVRALAIDDVSFPRGGIIVLNQAFVPIEVEIDGNTTRFPEDSMQYIPSDLEGAEFHSVKFRYSHSGSMRPFVMTNWSHGEDRLRLALVDQESPEAPPTISIVDDIEAPAE